METDNPPILLTIGFATTATRKESYLLDTLKSVIAGIPTERYPEVRIVVFNADGHEGPDLAAAREKFRHLIEAGLIHIVQSDQGTYPQLEAISAGPGKSETPGYLKWRSKQCLDYAALFESCSGTSAYYLQIEDDIICTADYYEEIRSHLKRIENKQWSYVRYCNLGFIGILFRSEELTKLASLFRNHYDELPVDWLLDCYDHIKMKADIASVRYNKTLFQHMGHHSSLPGKIQGLKAENFEASLTSRIIRRVKKPFLNT